MEFEKRHTGLNESEQQAMLDYVLAPGKTLDDLTKLSLPQSITAQYSDEEKFRALTEPELLAEALTASGKNSGFKSIIGQGYYNTHTPSVILRDILQNPGWYTAYTPYQAEISQGRLEALINFQTMVSDLTGMELSNSSLLDEGTALSEAVAMALNITRAKSENKKVLVEEGVFPQSVAVLKTRMTPLLVEVIEFKADELSTLLEKYNKDVFAVVAQTPTKTGDVLENLKSLFSTAKNHGAVPIAATDLLFCTLFEAPGESGAEIVVGSSQRFGVPLGYGGPHAAFLSTLEKHKRLIPGRIIGVSKDSKGNLAYRLALQTREQHIRREKATSNICTAQVLLAVVASMYAVYHGPKGLKSIASKVKKYTDHLKAKLSRSDHKILNQRETFDTLTFEASTHDEQQAIKDRFLSEGLNINMFGKTTWGFSVDETWDHETVKKVCRALNLEFKPEELAEGLAEHQESEKSETSLKRTSDFMTHPNFNSYHTETKLMRYMKSLENKDFSLVHGMIPLGSCTMKLNAATEMQTISMPGFSNVHPFAPKAQCTGYKEMIDELDEKLCKLTGFSKFSFQPNSGAQGEFAGLMSIRRYHLDNNGAHRNLCLVPSSAHGTNPASAVMSGFKVVPVLTDDQGNIDIHDLTEKVNKNKENIAALMVTYPSTHGVYEEGIKNICDIVHEAGGLVYMDGANMNALVGLSKPAEIGMDVAHLNLHKTFCIPHGGGGPGVGPIGVVDRLKDYLPTDFTYENALSISATEFGSASILPISWSYIKMMGFEGLRRATQVAVLNANYLAKKLSSHYKVMYTGTNGLVAHECILDTRTFKEVGVTVDDIAKRLIDYGFHAPTMSWPVVGTLMIEPTESESKSELDKFAEAMIEIAKEVEDIKDGNVKAEESPLKNAPHSMRTLTSDAWDYSYSREKAGFPTQHSKTNKFFPTVDRVDNAYGDLNLFCSCPPLDSYT